MKRAAQTLAAAATALLIALPASAQRRPASPLAPPAPVVASASFRPLAEVVRTSSAAQIRTSKPHGVLGSAALAAGGMGTMYLAYDRTGENGNAFRSYVGALGALSFWIGVYRLAKR